LQCRHDIRIANGHVLLPRRADSTRSVPPCGR
jgi:hypothetical protein